MHKKVENTILQEFPKDFNTSLKQVHGKRVKKKEKTTFFLTHHSVTVYEV